jgi:glycosyltransferase involved in cell wall biosynthesis
MYLSRARLGLVLLDAWCYSYEISVPDKLIDMLACGLPVLSSDKLVEVRRILATANCGITVNVDDIKAISDGIINILTDQTLRISMQQNAFEYCKRNHSFEKLKDDLRLVVQEIDSMNS